ncbi:MAG: sulfatase [bacterium]
MKKTKPNVILITVDSLRADHLGCYGYSKPTSPNIDRLAEESYLFTNAFSNGPNTPHAFPPIMASRYPLMSNRFGLFDAKVTMAELLKSMGYKTAGFVAANCWVSRYFQYQRGFDLFEDFIEFASFSKNNSKIVTALSENELTLFQKSLDGMAKIAKGFIPAGTKVYQFLEHWKVFLKSHATVHHSVTNKKKLLDEFYGRTSNWIDLHADPPFFLWLHIMDTHYPYAPQRHIVGDFYDDNIDKYDAEKIAAHLRFKRRADPRIVQQGLILYDATIREMDFRVGAILSQLKSKNLYDNSIIVITADHGEEFQDHNGLLHKSKLYDELIHVPFLMKTPESNGPKKVHTLISHIGLVPTICRLLGIENNTEDMFGHAFTQVFHSNLIEQRNFVISEASYDADGQMPMDEKVFDLHSVPKVYSLRTQNWKLIRESRMGPTHLFDLQADPGEQNNLIKQRQTLAEKLDELLRMHMELEQSTILRNKIRVVKGDLMHVGP